MEFILLLLSFLLLSSPATSSNDAVLDADGDSLQRGQLYYAESVLSRGGAGGLRLAALDSESCPLTVVKGPFNDPSGQPLALFPENKQDDTVREGSTLYIVFAEPTRCSESTTWKYDPAGDRVTTGGSTSSSIGPHYSRFAISNQGRSDRHVYQIQPCPCSVGVERPSCRMGCLGNLGVGERRELTVKSNFVHTVVFRKVNKAAMEPAIHTKAE